MPLPDLHALRYFLDVCETGNVTQAAERNSIAISSVTKKLQELREYYGVPLLDRRSRGMVPTPAGQDLAREVRTLLAKLVHIEHTMSDFAEGMRGVVRVHASASIIIDHLAAMIAAFTRETPLIRVDLHEAMSWSVVRNVYDGHSEIGLVAAPVEIPDELATLPYHSDTLMAVLPLDHALAGATTVSFEQLLEHEHVGIGTLSVLSVLLDEEAGRLGRTIKHSYRVETCEVARQMVAAGLGFAILPEGLARPCTDAKTALVVPISDPWCRRTKKICYREAALAPPARMFLEHLKASVDR